MCRVAAQFGHIGVVQELVKRKDIDLEKPGKSHPARGFQSPLQVARELGHEAVAKVLLAAGAKDDEAAATVGEA